MTKSCYTVQTGWENDGGKNEEVTLTRKGGGCGGVADRSEFVK